MKYKHSGFFVVHVTLIQGRRQAIRHYNQIDAGGAYHVTARVCSASSRNQFTRFCLPPISLARS